MAELETAAQPATFGQRLARVRQNRLIRQNLVLFVGGLVAGIGGFVYHAIAGRRIPGEYGEVASLVSGFAIGNTATLILILILARYAAKLQAEDNPGGVRYLIGRGSRLLALPSLLFVLAAVVLSGAAQDFLHLRSNIPIIWLAVAIVMIWQCSVPRGVLQGTQHFSALSANLALEMVVRTLALFGLLTLGLGVNGSVIAIFLGALFAYLIGLGALRELFAVHSQRVRLRAMAGFSLTATVGTLGILLLYNQDVILAKHYLDTRGAGVYGALNKIGTILYFLSLSVSQVMFPRVVEAIAKDHHPGRLLLLSAGIMCIFGLGTLLVFGVVPWLVVAILFPAFPEATPFILAMGLIGLAISLANLLVQFFMAAHDIWFMPILAASCVAQALLIALFHGGVGQVVVDVLVAVLALLAALSLRCLLLMPKLHPQALERAC